MSADEKIGWTNSDATLAFFDKYEELKVENKALKETLGQLIKPFQDNSSRFLKYFAPIVEKARKLIKD